VRVVSCSNAPLSHSCAVILYLQSRGMWPEAPVNFSFLRRSIPFYGARGKCANPWYRGSTFLAGIAHSRAVLSDAVETAAAPVAVISLCIGRRPLCSLRQRNLHRFWSAVDLAVIQESVACGLSLSTHAPIQSARGPQMIGMPDQVLNYSYV